MRSTPGWTPSPRHAIKRRRFRRTNPNDVRNLNALASIHRGIGKTLAKQGKTADALDSLRQAIVLGERIAAEDNLFTYDLACGLALYGEFVGRDRSAPDKDSNNNSQHYSDKAMDGSCGKPSTEDGGRPIGQSAIRNSARSGPDPISRH